MNFEAAEFSRRDDEVIQLVETYLEDVIDDEHMQRLNTALLTDVRARRLFERLCLQDQGLRRIHRPSAFDPFPLHEEEDEDYWGNLEELSPVSNPPLRHLAPVDAGKASSISARRHGQALPGRSSDADVVFSIAGINVYRSTAVRRTGITLNIRHLAAVAAMLALAATAWWAWPTSQEYREPGQLVEKSSPDGQWNEPVPAGHIDLPVARVTGVVDAEWDQAVPLRRGVDLHRGKRFKLTGGNMEITLNQGAKVLLDAPCEVVLDGVNGLSLERGKMVARVTPGSKHFKVQTAAAEVIDLGTEFGVEVDERMDTLVQVYEGVVSLTVGDDEASRQTRLLMSEQSVRVDHATARIREQPYAPHYFRRTASDPKLAYARAVFVLNPLAYWDFEGATTDAVIRDRAGSRHATRMDAVTFTEGRVGDTAAVFNGDNSVIAIPGFAGKLNEQFTVSAWIAPRSAGGGGLGRILSYSDIVSNGTRAQRPTGWEIGCSLESSAVSGGSDRNHLFAHAPTTDIPVTERFNVDTPDDTIDFESGEWRHVVVTFGPATSKGQWVTWYLDGEPVHFDHMVPSVTAYEGPLLIGNWPDSNSDDEDWNRGFDGFIDDVAIFDRVLNDDEVRTLYRAALPLTPATFEGVSE